MAAVEESTVNNMIDAATSGNLHVLKALLEITAAHHPNLADVNITFDLSATAAKEWGGKTALHAACERGHEEIVKWLLEREANVKCYDARRRTPVVVCFENNHVHLAKMLIEVLRKLEPVKQPSATDEAVKAAINNNTKKADDDRSTGDDETGLDPVDIELVIQSASEMSKKCTRSACSDPQHAPKALRCWRHSEQIAVLYCCSVPPLV
eukprot:13996-Heterococcus_DN1.PRE.1